MNDPIFLHQALEHAKLRRGFCSPNPSVGAVIVSSDGTVLSSGHHFASGHSHAEIDALTKLNLHAPQATLYVTLEPCCHWGKTPPCTEALINAGIKRVVYAHQDPDPRMSGKGAAALTQAGIVCDYLPLPEAALFYQSYDHWQHTHLPFVTAKIALTLDGKIAGTKGAPVQITGKPLAEFTHFSRLHSDAILTTAKTIIADDPQLNARYQHATVAKPLYIIDRNLTLPMTAKIMTTAKSIVLFYDKNNAELAARAPKFPESVRCIAVDSVSGTNKLNLTEVLRNIGQDGIHDLWVEAGGTCFASLIQANLVQKAFVYVAPRWLGAGQAAFPDDFSFSKAKHFTWRPFENDVLCEIAW